MRGTGIVVAHYHPQGMVRDDLVDLIAELASTGSELIFVSTHLREDSAARLAKNVRVIVRDNHGYDFYSYKTGLDALAGWQRLSRLTIFNSSFLCVDRRKLIDGFFAREHTGFDAFGLTYSREHRRHLQSFLISFGSRCLSAAVFEQWWSQMNPIDDRNQVIARYELGLSSYLRRAGFSLGRAYHPTLGEMRIALSRAIRSGRRTWNPLTLNPTHFYWDFLLRDFGIVKIEILKKDPNRLIDAGLRGRLELLAGAAGAQ